MSRQGPRPPHPPPAPASVLRVQPQVPEPSLFMSENNQHFSPVTRPVLHHQTPPQPFQTPPPPHQPPTHHLQPQSELSRQFHKTEATLFLSSGGSNESLS